MFYPTVHGTETAETRPTFWPKLFAWIPIVGWIWGKNVKAKYTYDDRQAAINLHCRLVNEKSSEIEWIKNFTGEDKIRINGWCGPYEDEPDAGYKYTFNLNPIIDDYDIVVNLVDDARGGWSHPLYALELWNENDYYWIDDLKVTSS